MEAGGEGGEGEGGVESLEYKMNLPNALLMK